ncbi:MAG: xanthine dehydrogenase family protein subunit M [Acidobacteriota bacterium]|nr:xanthine dehydrogenase family protein subunit M [Acidobacteriota bacterium]
MKPPVFDYVAPESLDGALDALAEHGYDAKILSGGQSLIPLLNFRLAQPGILIDLNRIGGLDEIRLDESGNLRIGGMTRVGTLEREPLVAEHAPLLFETVPSIAHPQIRNRGTVGGSLAHADPSGELPVIAVASGAQLTLRSPKGERTVAAEDFFVGLMTTDLAMDEILVEVSLPPLPPRTGTAFVEIARRLGDYAQAGVAAVVTLGDDDRVADARLVYLSAGDIPMQAPRAVELLRAEGVSEAVIEKAARLAAAEEIEPSDDIHASAAFKRHLATVVTKRALAVAIERARS